MGRAASDNSIAKQTSEHFLACMVHLEDGEPLSCDPDFGDDAVAVGATDASTITAPRSARQSISRRKRGVLFHFECSPSQSHRRIVVDLFTHFERSAVI
jgi:hypothetical protein